MAGPGHLGVTHEGEPAGRNLAEFDKGRLKAPSGASVAG
jgi:hypothetical protein